MSKAKGIFCIEADSWYDDIQHPWSVAPILTLLKESHSPPVNSIHRRAATINEFEHNLNLWLKTKKFPILFLGYHGRPGKIVLTSELSLDWFAERLAGKGEGRMIHFGSCETLQTHGNRLNWFLKTTNLTAITGYKRYVNWTEAAAMDLLVLSSLQRWTFTRQGLKAVHRSLTRLTGKLVDHLGFWMVR